MNNAYTMSLDMDNKIYLNKIVKAKIDRIKTNNIKKQLF